MNLPGKHTSPWTETGAAQTFAPLSGDLNVDVAIVGAGITGLTAAALLKRAGLRVAVVEGLRIGSGVSGRTTAHLTLSADTHYQELISDFGQAGAQQAATSQRAAIERIAQFVAEEQIDCDFQRVPGYLYTETPEDVALLQQEYTATQSLGLDTELTDDVPLPFPVQQALCFAQQAQFHPLKYLYGLARTIPGGGCHLFEQTRVLDIRDDSSCRVRTTHGTITAAAVVLATHAPIHSFTFLTDLLLTVQTKMIPYRSYVLGVRLAEAAPQGLFWDTEDPYHYIRSYQDEQGELLIVGGADHKTGHKTATENNYGQIEAYVYERFAVERIDYHWSAQSYEPADGLPYIGNTNLHPQIYLATGYSGNGMTFGTLAAMILADQIVGKPNQWRELYDANRLHLSAGGQQLVEASADMAARFIGDRLKAGPRLREVPNNSGQVLSLGGEQFAIYRDEQGRLHSYSPVCTHAHCIVQWNSAERTWDCPCHGGRYDAHGFVLEGPPVYDLEPKPLPDWTREDASIE